MSDRRRKLAFAGAVVVLLGITAFSTLREPGPPPRHDARPQQPADTSAIRTEPSRVGVGPGRRLSGGDAAILAGTGEEVVVSRRHPG
jgi:hypothetical protein